MRTEEGEQAAARGVRRVAEGQGEDGPGSVGDSGATPIVVWRWWWWRWSDGGVGRRKKKRHSSAEEEEREVEEEEDEEVERRGELTFSCAGKVRQSLTDRLT